MRCEPAAGLRQRARTETGRHTVFHVDVILTGVMLTFVRGAIVASLVLAGCNSSSPSPPARPATPATSAPAPQPADPSCGMKTTDWCPSPPGDPCGAHKDAASCKADPRCGGMPYRGESFVACQLDDRGFATNCPVVGCKSL